MNWAPLDVALLYANRGWHVFPCHSIKNDRCTCNNYDSCSPGKHPRIQKGLLNASIDPDQIKTWWTKWPDANIAIRTGAISDLVVIDIDPRHDGDNSLDRLEYNNYHLPIARTIKTGSGGRHLYFSHPGVDVHNDQAGKLGPGLDVRGDGGYVLAPPSIHISGGIYEVSENRTEIPELPKWIISILNPPKPKRIFKPRPTTPSEVPSWANKELAEALDRLWRAPEGMRNNTLNSTAFRLGQMVGLGYLDKIDIENHLISVAQQIGLPEREAAMTINSAVNAGISKPYEAEKKPTGTTYEL